MLLEAPLIGSALALVRTLFETTIRGIWLYRCATDDEVARFATDPRDLHINDLIEAVEQVYHTEAAYPATKEVLARMKQLNWAAMCSFAHGGFHQASRRITATHITPKYGEDEQLKVIEFADFCFFVAAVEILNLANKPELANEWAEKFSAKSPV